MDSLLLSFLDLLKKPLERAGVDYPQMRRLVALKLLMDNRRVKPAFGGLSYKNDAEAQQQVRFGRMLLANLLFSLIPSLYLTMFPPDIRVLIMCYSFIFTMTIMTLIVDFSTVLLDQQDNAILLPRPMSGTTLLAARIGHILLYLVQVVFSISTLPFIAVYLVFGALPALGYIGVIMLMTMLALVITNLLYLLIMRFMDEERVRNTVNILQILFTVLLMGGYQILPRLLGTAEWMWTKSSFSYQWWAYVMPPVWMAAVTDFMRHGGLSTTLGIVTAELFLIPMLGLWLMFRYGAPVFSQKLAVMDQDKTAERESEGAAQSSKGLITKLAEKIVRNPVELATMLLVWRMIARDQKTRLRVYPQVMVGLVMCGSSILSPHAGSGRVQVIMGLYFLFFSVMGVAQVLRQSDTSDSGWVFWMAPIEKPGYLISGMWLAIGFWLVVPYVGIVLPLLVWLFSSDVIGDGLLILGVHLFLMFGYALISEKILPFSQPDQLKNSGLIAGRILGFTLLGVVLVGLHGVITWYAPVLVWPLTGLLLASAYEALRRLRQTAWNQVVL